jgi:dihydroorotase-like cyclic amidohydrolase
VLRPGSDADLMLVDLDRTWTITGERLYTKCGWTPYEGRAARARVEMTVLRGRVIMRDGEVIAEPGTGRYLKVAPRA